jgi:hypothetical protein
MREVDNSSRAYSLIALTSLLTAFLVFSYGYSIIDDELGTEEPKTFTISSSLAHGNKPGVIIFLCLSYIYIVQLNKLREIDPYLSIRNNLLLVSFALVISLLWITPTDYEEAHYTEAGIIFLLLFIYTVMTYYYFYKHHKTDKTFFYFMIGLSILITIGLIVFAGMHSDLDADIFASFEIAFGTLFIISIFVTGFY